MRNTLMIICGLVTISLMNCRSEMKPKHFRMHLSSADHLEDQNDNSIQMYFLDVSLSEQISHEEVNQVLQYLDFDFAQEIFELETNESPSIYHNEGGLEIRNFERIILGVTQNDLSHAEGAFQIKSSLFGKLELFENEIISGHFKVI